MAHKNVFGTPPKERGTGEVFLTPELITASLKFGLTKGELQGLRHAFEIGGYDMRPMEGIPPPKTEKSSDFGHYFSKMVQIHIKK